MMKAALREAFRRSIPILCSYAFVGMAYGMMMAEAGQKWYVALLISLAVYTGAFQFVLISFLAGGVSLGVIALTALLMNGRQLFYSITFLEDFSRTGAQSLHDSLDDGRDLRREPVASGGHGKPARGDVRRSAAELAVLGGGDGVRLRDREPDSVGHGGH